MQHHIVQLLPSCSKHCELNYCKTSHKHPSGPSCSKHHKLHEVKSFISLTVYSQKSFLEHFFAKAPHIFMAKHGKIFMYNMFEKVTSCYLITSLVLTNQPPGLLLYITYKISHVIIF